MLGNLLEIAARHDKDLNEPLVLSRQIREPGTGILRLNGYMTAVTRHPGDGHHLLAIWAKVGCGHKHNSFA